MTTRLFAAPASNASARAAGALPLLAVLAALAMVMPSLAHAQKKGKKKKKSKDDTEQVDKKSADDGFTAKAKGKAKIIKRGKKGSEKLFDFTGLQLEGNLRMPQLLYFLDRANQELERASLERRSFVPEMVRSLDEEAL